MKCRMCQRRKGTIATTMRAVFSFSDSTEKIMLCEKCRREFLPTTTEREHDDEQEMYRSERQAEYHAFKIIS